MISAALIAERLGLPVPTAEQSAIIEAERLPALVIAGAGSGKTETMAARVVWLLANGHVAPAEILGLTFTRKAAGELSARIQRRVLQLSRSGLLGEHPFDPLDTPTVTTYNAFAAAVFRDHAHVIGRDSDSSVLSEASAWLLARKIVLASTDERLIELDKSPDILTEAVLRLNRAIAENSVDADDLTRFSADFRRLEDLPRGGRGSGVLKEVATSVESIGCLPALLDLARSFELAKQARGSIEFADQVALAHQVLETAPELRADYRDRYRVVLLDEYQDTSVAQTRFLSSLFHDHPVMAVGDPHQSIYGWRGASAANLARFADHFAREQTAAPFTLDVSWRNPERVLALANAVIQPFGSGSVGALRPRPGAQQGTVETSYTETIEDEAEAVAVWLGQQLDRPTPPSAAILCRSLKTIHPFLSALHRHNVPYRVLGIGGLLEQPAVADLLCTLRVLRHADANAELIRLLSGARWQIGIRDLDVLGRIARWLTTRDHARRALDKHVVQSVRDSVADDDQRSLVDALDFVGSAPLDHPQLAELSPEARSRMREFAAELASLRSRAGLGLLELVVEVEQSTLLDIEVASRIDDPSARWALDAFEEQVAAFHTDDPTADLGAFLAWIREAERRDSLSPRSDDPEAGVVQILTIHGAKGLEWDVVAVPRAVDGELPSDPRTTRGWLGFGELPYEFRADSSELPVLAWRAVHEQTEFGRAVDNFKELERSRHRDEERRLAYVAVTRARTALLVSGSFWSSQVKYRPPSIFLREAAAAGVLSGPLPDEPEHDTNPLQGIDQRIAWPADPLGDRRLRLKQAAELVREAPGEPTRWDELITLLLAERDMSQHEQSLPTRVAASHFQDYIDDPIRVLNSRQRPLPQRPHRQASIGTEFHGWVESRYAGPGQTLPFDEIDDPMLDELDFDHSGGELWNEASLLADTSGDRGRAERLKELQERFASSRWGNREPEDVEIELHVPLAGHIVVCKIDAVFAIGDRYEIVDWKTGAQPTTKKDMELRQYQLSLYRLAYARWKNVPLDHVDALFYFVADDAVVAPPSLLSEKELATQWRRVAERVLNA